MSQRRMGVILGGVVLAVAAVSVPAHAQGPQRGNRGGPGGPGGFMGGRGGFGGFMGGSLADLAGREAVAKEIQVTEEQKPQIEQLARESRDKRNQTMQQLRQRNDRARSQVRDAQPNIPQVAPNNNAGGAGFGSGFAGGVAGFDADPYGANAAANQGPSPAQMQQMAQMQQRQQENMVRMQGFQQMRQAMDGLQRQSDQTLSKILNKDQMTRLRQIQLQMEGPFAVISNEELAKKLSITAEQAAEIRDVQAKANESRMKDMQQRRGIFETVRNSLQAAAPGGQPGARPDAQQGGRGGRGGSNFDRDAFRKVMEQPEVKAQLDQIQQHENSLREQSYARVFKALDRRQSSTYKKMLGEPFDVNSMMRGFFTGGPPADQAPAADENAAEATRKSLVDDEDDAPAEAKPADAPAEAKPADEPAEEAPASRPSSLRQRRGLGNAKP